MQARSPISPAGRPLGFAETFLQRFHDDLDGGLVTVAMARLNRLPSVGEIQTAARKAVRRHPLLRMRIEIGAGGRPAFREDPEAGDISPVAAEGAPQEVFERLIGAPLPPDGPLRELHVLAGPRPHLFLKIHHAIADGLAARSLLNEILAVAEGAEQGPPPPLRPCVEELTARSRESFAEPLPPPSGAEPWRFTDRAPLAERRCRAVFRETPARPLATRAHQAGLTVNGLLLAALVRSVRDLRGFPAAFPVVLPVGVRNRLDPAIPGEEMGCLIGNAVVAVDAALAAAPSVKAAPLLARQLAHAVAAEITGPASFSAADVDAAVAPFADPARDHFVFPLALSNIGLDPAPSPLVEASWFGASVRPGHLGVLAAVATTGDNLCLAFHFAEPLVPASAVERFADRVAGELSGKAGPV